MRSSKNTEEREYPRKELILDLLKAGALLTVAFMAPKAAKLFVKNPDYHKWKDFHRPLLVRNIKNLQRKGLVQKYETEEGFEIPDEVKIVVAESVENDDDLRAMYPL